MNPAQSPTRKEACPAEKSLQINFLQVRERQRRLLIRLDVIRSFSSFSLMPMSSGKDTLGVSRTKTAIQRVSEASKISQIRTLQNIEP